MASTKRTRTRSGERTRTSGKPAEQHRLANQARQSRLKAALALGGAVAAGLFLWSRRSSVSDRFNETGEQLGDLRENAGAERQDPGPNVGQEAPQPRRRARRSQADIAQEALTLKQLGTVDGG